MKRKHITIIGIILIVSILLSAMLLQSCSKKSDADKEQPVETNEITDTIDTSKQETSKDTESEKTEPEYVETTYPSGLTVEEKIVGYEVHKLGKNEEYYGIDLYASLQATRLLPDKFAVTCSDIPDFAGIVECTEKSTAGNNYAITTVYYKNVELELDPSHYVFFEPSGELLYADGILVIGQSDRYYSGWAYLISTNNYTIVGEEQPVTTNDPLDTYPSYRFYGENGELHYYSPCVTNSLYISSKQESGGLFTYLSKESDLDHLYEKHGKVVYEKGKFKLVDTNSITIKEKWGDIQKEYEAAMFDDEIYEKYPTYQEYLAAKEQNLLPEDHYYYRGKYGENY